jgi:hypothetical protein
VNHRMSCGVSAVTCSFGSAGAPEMARSANTSMKPTLRRAPVILRSFSEVRPTLCSAVRPAGGLRSTLFAPIPHNTRAVVPKTNPSACGASVFNRRSRATESHESNFIPARWRNGSACRRGHGDRADQGQRHAPVRQLTNFGGRSTAAAQVSLLEAPAHGQVLSEDDPAVGRPVPVHQDELKTVCREAPRSSSGAGTTLARARETVARLRDRGARHVVETPASKALPARDPRRPRTVRTHARER